MLHSIQLLQASVQRRVDTFLSQTPEQAVLRNGLQLLSAFTFAGVFNYLFHLVVGRMLRPQEYAIVVAFINLTVTLTAPFGVLQVIVTDFTTHMSAQGMQGRISYLLKRLFAALGAALAVLFALLVILRSWLASLLGTPSLFAHIGLVIAAVVTIGVVVLLGVVQGWKQYRILSAARILGGVGRFVIAMPLLFFGFGLNGTLAAVVLSTTIMLVYLAILVYRKLRGVTPSPVGSEMRGFLRNAGYFAASRLAMALLLSADVIFATMRFAPETAGHYSGAATLGNMLLFFIVPVQMLVFTEVSERHARGHEKHQHLAPAFWFVGISALAFTTVCLLLPGWIVRMYYGPEYAPAASILGLYALSRLVVVFMSMLSTYLNAQHDWRYTGLVCLAALVQTVLMTAVLDDPLSYIWAMIIISSIVVMIGGVWAWRGSRQQGTG